MIILDVPQLSDEWFDAKCGIPSASNFHLIVDMKGNPSKSRTDYMRKLAWERIKGVDKDSFMSWDMKRGIENEPTARKVYTDNCVHSFNVSLRQVGLCYFNEEKKYSCSPDLLVGEDGGLEIKDAKDKVQRNRFFDGWSLSKVFQQVQGSLHITSRSWWDRMSHNLGAPFRLQIVERIERDETFIAKLKIELETFCEELDVLTERNL